MCKLAMLDQPHYCNDKIFFYNHCNKEVWDSSYMTIYTYAQIWNYVVKLNHEFTKTYACMACIWSYSTVEHMHVVNYEGRCRKQINKLNFMWPIFWLRRLLVERNESRRRLVWNLGQSSVFHAPEMRHAYPPLSWSLVAKKTYQRVVPNTCYLGS